MGVLGQALPRHHSIHYEEYSSQSSNLRTIRGKAQHIGPNNMYRIPEGHGEYSGKIIDNPTFEYVVKDDMMIGREFEKYNFANDIEFATKLKAMYHNHAFRRTGRTRLQAQIAVDLGIETGEPIYFVDHTAMHNERNRHNSHYFMRQVEDIIDEYRRQGCDIQVVHLRRDECIALKLFAGHGIFEKIRIPTFKPEPAIKLETSMYGVMGVDPYQIEPKDNLLLICDV